MFGFQLSDKGEAPISCLGVKISWRELATLCVDKAYRFSSLCYRFYYFVSYLVKSHNYYFSINLAGCPRRMLFTADWMVCPKTLGPSKMKFKLVYCLIVMSFSAISQAPTFDWAVSVGGVDWEYSRDLAIDDTGNLYILGTFRDTVDFDPGPGISNLVSNGWDDTFILKLDPSGNFLWVKQIGGSSIDRGRSIALDATGNVYATGYFTDTVDFNPGSGVDFLISSQSSYDVFVLKLDASGNYQWAKQMSGSGDELGTSIAIDASANLYVTGWFTDTVDFNPGPGVSYLASKGWEDSFILKLDSSGNFLWVNQLGGSNNTWAASIKVDDFGNVYSTGSFIDSVDFDPGPGVSYLASSGTVDIFILKWDANGNFLWAKHMGGGDFARGSALSIDDSGQVYTTGHFKGTIDFDPGNGATSLSSNGGGDIFIQKLDANGDFLWVKKIGGSKDDAGNSIAIDVLGGIYITGTFESTVDFDPGSGVSNLISNGGVDIFIQKLDASGNSLWVEQMGGTDYEDGIAIKLDASGNVYTTGSFGGTVDFDPSSGVNNLTSKGSNDIYLQKLAASDIGISESKLGYEVLIYPNPSTGSFSINLGERDYNVSVTIVDLNGKKVYSRDHSEGPILNLQIDEPAGLYHVIIKSDQNQDVIKVVIE